MSTRPPPRPTPARSDLTKDLMASGQTDVARWQDPGNLATQWDGRAEIASRMIGAAPRRILDVGAGAMTLRSLLPADVQYVPADVVQRSDDCLVVDLNRRQFPEGTFDVVTFLGVLEYIHDPLWPLVKAAEAAAELVVSYCADVSGDIEYRRGLGWVNDLTEAQFAALLARAGWRVVARAPYKRNANNAQSVWKCVRVDAPAAASEGAASRALAALPQKDFVVITPYLVDPASAKKVNVGDGFIADSACRLLGARPTALISSRMAITDEDLERINASRLVLVAGANTLKSDFRIAPNFTPDLLRRIKAPVAICGIGHYGVPQATAEPLDAAADAVVRGVLERFPYVSVRCDASADYLRRSAPDLAARVLMTSCPVAHPVDGIDRGFAAKDRYDQLVCTITDRGALEGQLALLRAARGLFPARRRVVALHQDYGNAALRQAIAALGYEVFRSPDYADFLDLYADTDIHFGNRLHAHLKCLSMGVRSFLTPFDLRQQYFAESLDFPLITRAPNPAFEDYDFARARARIDQAAKSMRQFMDAVRVQLDRS